MVTARGTGGSALVIVANTRSAEFFTQSQRFSVPESLFSLQASEIEGAVPAQPSDQPGKAFDSFGTGRHKMEPGISLRDEAAENFAQAIVQRMTVIAAREEVQGFVIIAAPRFLGMLRNEIGRRSIASQERLEIGKDVVGASASDIGKIISDQGGLPRLG